MVIDIKSEEKHLNFDLIDRKINVYLGVSPHISSENWLKYRKKIIK